MLPKTASFAIAIAALITGCGKPPTSPSAPTATTPPASASSLTALQIDGPSSIPPGQTAQFAVIATLADGSTRNVTTESGIRSTNERVLSITPSGFATAHDTGRFPRVGSADVSAFLFAELGLYQQSRQVLVLPTATYRVWGNVTDAGAPLAGFRVDIMTGSGAGLSSVACQYPHKCDGYEFWGLSGVTEIRVTNDGYAPSVKTVNVTDHIQVPFELKLLNARATIAGTYTLTVMAAAECAAKLPEAIRTRRYTAILTQDGPLITARLSGANFLFLHRDYFTGNVAADRVTFPIGGRRVNDEGTMDLYPDVLEQLTETSFATVSGFAATTYSAGTLAGTLEGRIDILHRAAPNRFDEVASCDSEAHRFVLEPFF
jgi:hypothetical protein